MTLTQHPPVATTEDTGTGRGPTLLAVASIAVAVALFYQFWPVLLGVEQGDLTSTVTLLVEGTMAAIAAVLLVAGSRRVVGDERTSWRLIALGVVCWAAGSLLWTGISIAGGEPEFPGPVDVLYLGLFPFTAAGLMLHPAPHRRERIIRSTVDGLLVATSLLLIIWTSALRVTFSEGVSVESAELVVNLIYPVGDTLLIVMAVALLVRVGNTAGRALFLLAAGLTAVAAADLAFFVLTTLGVYETSSMLWDSLWPIGFVLVGAAGLSLSATPGGPWARSESSQETVLAMIPSWLGGLALLFGVVDLSLGWSDPRYALTLVLAVAGLLLARQSIAVVEGRRLAHRLAGSIDRLGHEVRHDRLTGLHNRNGLSERLVDQRRDADAVVGLMFVDIDHLKSVNDSLGHEVGDTLIVSVADHLAERLGHDRVCRFGGDEFIALVDGASRADLDARAEAITTGTAATHHGNLPLAATLSVGLAVWEPGETVEETLRRADTALYRAKASGRRRVVSYSPEMDAATRRRVALEPELARALDRGELEVHYQPVVALADNRIIGAEALVRWRHPTRGLLTPPDFLDDADATGLMDRIGQFVLDTATSDFARLASAPGVPPVRLSVNLSTSELATADTTRRVHDALSRTGLVPGVLTIEITEDVVVDDTTRRTIDELHELGVSIAIDDFGTGNSSLRQLGTYPADVLKVDRTFVDGLGRDTEDTFVVRAIINLANTLGMATIAEGVETLEQVEILAQLGCDAGQGWWFGRAERIEELRQRLCPAPPGTLVTPPGPLVTPAEGEPVLNLPQQAGEGPEPRAP